MVAVEGRFTFTAERPQLSCAAFFMAEPNEVISLDYDGVDIDCGGGDFITVRSHICTQETSSRWEMKHQKYSVSMTTYLFTRRADVHNTQHVDSNTKTLQRRKDLSCMFTTMSSINMFHLLSLFKVKLCYWSHPLLMGPVLL